MTEIKLFKRVGNFAEDKDVAKDIRLSLIIPSLDKGDEVILDFENVDDATQSFIHALISDVIRKYGAKILDTVYFKNCNEKVQKMISIVVDYMQEAV